MLLQLVLIKSDDFLDIEREKPYIESGEKSTYKVKH